MPSALNTDRKRDLLVRNVESGVLWQYVDILPLQWHRTALVHLKRNSTSATVVDRGFSRSTLWEQNKAEKQPNKEELPPEVQRRRLVVESRQARSDALNCLAFHF